jgi:hypothetical protein
VIVRSPIMILSFNVVLPDLPPVRTRLPGATDDSRVRRKADRRLSMPQAAGP